MKKLLIILLAQSIVLSCSTEEDVPENKFTGTWKLESITVMDEKGQDITEYFRMGDLSGAVLTLGAGNNYMTTLQSPIRNNKVLRFLLFADPKYFLNDSTQAFGVWDVIDSGDLLFERGDGEILARTEDNDGNTLTLQTFTDFDIFSNASAYFYRMGKYAGRVRASSASTSDKYNDGFQLGSTYGLRKGYRERYAELWAATGIDDAYLEFVGDCINSNARGFVESIDADLTNLQPAFNLGFNDSYSTSYDEGRALATSLFKNTVNLTDHRKNYSLTYKFVRID